MTKTELPHGPYEVGYKPSGLNNTVLGDFMEFYTEFVHKVKALRDVQNAHAKTMQYGLRNEAIRLGKEVDEMLNKILGE
jgi:hypothetical protein